MSAKRNWAFIWLAVSLGLIVLFTAAPLISVFIAGGIADVLGCTIPISSIAPCPVMGIDLGETLTIMAYAGYLAFWTIPMGTPLLAVWFAAACIVTVVWWLRRRRRGA